MDLELGTRPLSIAHHSRDWHNHHQQNAGPSTSAAPPSSFASGASSQRRRSSAAPMPPPVPPPNLPMPSVPVPPRASIDDGEQFDEDNGYLPYRSNEQRQSVFGRPAASAKLAAVAAFSQARHAAAPNNVSPPAFSVAPSSSSSSENLSDPPPQSILHSSSRALTQHQDIVPDRLLLSPPETRPAETRPSSRRALTRALELAREAVQLDATNDDPHAAVVAYGRSVALLSEVMERVRRGEDSTETHRRRNGRRRSVVAQEEEVRRLKSIHDTYADRMNILSVIYSIPPIPHSPSSVYTSTMSISTDSTQPSSPSSTSPDSETSDTLSYRDSHREDYVIDEGVEVDMLDSATHEANAFAAAGSLSRLPIKNPQPAKPPTSYHPYAVPTRTSVDMQSSSSPIPPTTRSRSGSLGGRARASSALPPPAPPPQNSLPPAPAPVIHEPPPEARLSHSHTSSQDSTTHLSVIGRPRGNSFGHRRSGSGSKLVPLHEEVERHDNALLHVQQDDHYEPGQELQARIRRSLEGDTPRVLKRESHPLPPLPSPASVASTLPDTPRYNPEPEPQSPASAYHIPHTRQSSQFSSQSEVGGPPSAPQLINTSTTMGTIWQRRSKMSAPPSSGSASPPMEYSTAPSAANAARNVASAIPASTTSNLGYGRSRSSSQPGRRPSVAGGRTSPMDSRPPVPQTAGLNGSNVPRKASFPSKLNPNAPPPPLIIQTDVVSPTAGLPATSLVPPPPMFPGNLPTTPTSPLPPMPPNDTLRKPYHMMNLLRATMITKSGGYVTRRLHVPQEVWSQGGAKLTNLAEKVRVVEVLCSALEEVQNCSVEYFGAGNVSIGMALGIGSIGKKEGDAWIAKLEEFSSVCDGVVANFGKKLGVGEGFVLKKTGAMSSWGNKLTRRFGELTNGKNLDSPAAYVAGLTRLFLHAQLLDEHTRALAAQPVAPSYAAFPLEVRQTVEAKLKRSSEFFASVVLTFVIRDLSQLLDKYAKKCEKWLAE